MKTLLFCIFGSAGSGRAACRYRCGARCFLPENAPPQSFTVKHYSTGEREIKWGKSLHFVRKNTTEFSEISRWRWSECWGGDSPARHCRFVPATVKTVPANVGERHAAPGDALAVRTNRRQKWQQPPICHCEEAAGRRGNLGKAVTFSPKVSCYPPRFCEIGTPRALPRASRSGRHVASLLEMTRQGGAVVHHRPCAV